MRDYTFMPLDGPITHKTCVMDLEELQQYVGGFIEIVFTQAGEVICNEEGRLRQMTPNPHMAGFVGNIVIRGAFVCDKCGGRQFYHYDEGLVEYDYCANCNTAYDEDGRVLPEGPEEYNPDSPEHERDQKEVESDTGGKNPAGGSGQSPGL